MCVRRVCQHVGMGWLQRVKVRRTATQHPQGILIGQLTLEQIAERERQRVAAIATARAEVFAGVARVPLQEVTTTLPRGDLAFAGVDHVGRLVLASSTANPTTSYAHRDTASGWASFPHSHAADRVLGHDTSEVDRAVSEAARSLVDGRAANIGPFTMSIHQRAPRRRLLRRRRPAPPSAG